MSIAQRLFQSRGAFFIKVKNINKLCGGDRSVAAQAILKIDDEIAEKGLPGWKRDRAPGFESRAAGSNPAGRTKKHQTG